MRINNNTILLTGGSSGIGYELLKAFTKNKNKVIITSRDKMRLEKLKREFSGIETISCDLSNDTSVRDLINKCYSRYKNINIIVNNAGIQYNYNLNEEKQGNEKIEEETRVNFISPAKIIYGLLPLLMKNKNPAIINVSSGLAFTPKQSAPVYCATKAAIHNLTKALRYQLENTGVKVFEIIPPLVDTQMTEGRGKDKISPKQLVDEFIQNFKKDKFESNIGKVKTLRLLQRLLPKTADNMMKDV